MLKTKNIKAEEGVGKERKINLFVCVEIAIKLPNLNFGLMIAFFIFPRFHLQFALEHVKLLLFLCCQFVGTQNRCSLRYFVCLMVLPSLAEYWLFFLTFLGRSLINLMYNVYAETFCMQSTSGHFRFYNIGRYTSECISRVGRTEWLYLSNKTCKVVIHSQ